MPLPPTWIVIGMTLSAAGAFNRCRLYVVDPMGKAPQPVPVDPPTGVMVNATGLDEAVPPVVGVTVSQEGKAVSAVPFTVPAVVFTVKGVPRLAGEVTFRVCAEPAV